jgi:ADP-heptose:LPS heptosyltransferase
MKILLVRGDGIGDALVCAPLLAALRTAGHRVGAVLSTGNRHAFAQRAFERVHVLERIPWPRHGSTRASRLVALAEVRAERYDVALIASEEIEAYAFARAAGIARRVGFTNGWQKPLKTLQVRTLLTRALVRPADAGSANEHEIETLFRLGSGLHGEPAPTRDSARLRPLVLDAALSAHGAVVVQVSRKFMARGLDEAGYVAIARELRGRGWFALVVGEDPALAAGVAHAAGAPVATGLATRTWKELLAGASAIVTPDSGASHVAGMVGVPCVDLFDAHAATARDIGRWRPWAAPVRTRVLDTTRSPGGLGCDVADDVASLLERATPTRAALRQ